MPGGVRSHSRPHGLEPRFDQLLVLPDREMHKPVDSALRPRDAACVDVLPQKLSGIASVCRLLRRDVPSLARGSLVELVPVRPLGFGGDHSRNGTLGSVSCRAVPRCAPGAAIRSRLPQVSPTIRWSERTFNPETTLADCSFRRHQIGIDVVLEPPTLRRDRRRKKLDLLLKSLRKHPIMCVLRLRLEEML